MPKADIGVSWVSGQLIQGNSKIFFCLSFSRDYSFYGTNKLHLS